MERLALQNFVKDNLHILQEGFSIEKFPDGKTKNFLSPGKEYEFLKSFLNAINIENYSNGEELQCKILNLFEDQENLAKIITKEGEKIVVEKESVISLLEELLQGYFPWEK